MRKSAIVLWSGTRRPKSQRSSRLRPGFPLEPTARLHSVEIAVDVELQKHRRVEAGPARSGGLDAVKSKLAEIERIDEGVNRANRVLLVDPILKTLRQERRLPTICPFDEPLHDHPRESSGES